MKPNLPQVPNIRRRTGVQPGQLLVPPQGGPSIEITLPAHAVQRDSLRDPIFLALELPPTRTDQLLQDPVIKQALEELYKAGHGFVPGPQGQQIVFQGSVDSACMLLRALLCAQSPHAAEAALQVYILLSSHAGFGAQMHVAASQILQEMPHERQPLSLWKAIAATAMARGDRKALVRLTQACVPAALPSILKSVSSLDPQECAALIHDGFPLNRFVEYLNGQLDELKTLPDHRKAAMLDKLLSQLEDIAKLWATSDQHEILAEQMFVLAHDLMAIHRHLLLQETEMPPLALGALFALLRKVLSPDLTIDALRAEAELLSLLRVEKFKESILVFERIRRHPSLSAEFKQEMFVQLWQALLMSSGEAPDAARDRTIANRHLQLVCLLLQYGGPPDVEYAKKRLKQLFATCSVRNSIDHDFLNTTELRGTLQQVFLACEFAEARSCWQGFLKLKQWTSAVQIYPALIGTDGCTPEMAGALLQDLKDAWSNQLSEDAVPGESAATRSRRDHSYIPQLLKLAALRRQFEGVEGLQDLVRTLGRLRAEFQDDLAAGSGTDFNLKSNLASIKEQLFALATSLLEAGATEAGVDLWKSLTHKAVSFEGPKVRHRAISLVRTLVVLCGSLQDVKQVERLENLASRIWIRLLNVRQPWRNVECHWLLKELPATLRAIVAYDRSPSSAIWNIFNIYLDGACDPKLKDMAFAALVHWLEPVSDELSRPMLELAFDDSDRTEGIQVYVKSAWAIAGIRKCLASNPPDLDGAQHYWVQIDSKQVFFDKFELFEKTVLELMIQCLEPPREMSRSTELWKFLEPVEFFDHEGNRKVAATVICALIDQLKAAERPIDDKQISVYVRVMMLLCTTQETSILQWIALMDSGKWLKSRLPPSALVAVLENAVQTFNIDSTANLIAFFYDELTPSTLAVLENAALAAGPGRMRILIRALSMRLPPKGQIFDRPDSMSISNSIIRLLDRLPNANSSEIMKVLELRSVTRTGLAYLANEWELKIQRNIVDRMPFDLASNLLIGMMATVPLFLYSVLRYKGEAPLPGTLAELSPLVQDFLRLNFPNGDLDPSTMLSWFAEQMSRQAFNKGYLISKAQSIELLNHFQQVLRLEAPNVIGPFSLAKFLVQQVGISATNEGVLLDFGPSKLQFFLYPIAFAILFSSLINHLRRS